MIKNLIILLLLILLFSTQCLFGQKTCFWITPEITNLDANDQAYKDVGPGDTLLIVAGNRQYLVLKNFRGLPGKPIVMMNSGGAVIIDTDNYFGISIQNCRYFKFTGTGDANQFYGFQIKRVANGAGMGVGYLSSDFEIDHVSIDNCLIGGIYAKTDPDCSLTSVRGTFTQYNTSIHDNYISNAGNEGLYVGSSKYDGQLVNCDGVDVLLFPSWLEGVKIYNNIIQYSGWDGIQVSSASKDCQIYNNTILFDSQAEYDSQMSGILIGGGSKCDCYNNFISQGKGDGIEIHGLGGNKIFNNIIVDAGRTFLTNDLTQMKHGIFVSDVSVQNDSAFFILQNDIINPKSEGIRFSSIKSKKSMIASNVIINPGNYDYYQNGNTSFKGSDSYIMFQYEASDVIIRNNYLARNANSAGFLSKDIKSVNDFRLTAGSSLIDAADPESKIAFDFSDFPRPFGSRSDIGAFEYNATESENILLPDFTNENQLIENPVKDFLKIYWYDELNNELVLNVYDIKGKKICHFEKSELILKNQILQALVSNLRSGIYFYVLSSDKHISSGKFIKH